MQKQPIEITVAQAAELLGIDESQVRRYVRRKAIAARPAMPGSRLLALSLADVVSLVRRPVGRPSQNSTN